MKLLLSTICVVLLALFAYQVMSYPMNIDEINALDKPDDKLTQSIDDYELPKLTVLKDIKQYREIVARPLFDKNRKGAIQTRSVNRVATVNELSHLILVGTARSSEVQIGIIADTKAKQMERLKAGEKYKDWNIAEIAPDYVLFQNADLEHKLYVTPINGRQKNNQTALFSQLNKSNIDRSRNVIQSNHEAFDDEVVINQYPKTSVRSRNDDLKPQIRSPIKIPVREESYTELYDGHGENGNNDHDVSEIVDLDISAEDFYDDEDISDIELKALEALGAKIFDN
ncbi:MAG: hypothetical protein AAF304_02115 [Pseudomonadota bacterium]